MSGIVTICGIEDETEPSRMLARLSHRGVDRQSGTTAADSWIGSCWTERDHTSSQPMTSNDGSLHMVADGEIYNHQALLEEIDAHGVEASIEAVLPLYQRYGVDAFGKLDGRFALAIVDNRGAMTVARDPLGIAPLYWYRDGERAIFASEIGAFNDDVIAAVEAFPPGHAWSQNEGLRRIAEPMSRDCNGQPPANRDALLEEIRNKLVASVEAQMMDDTEVAAFLSGGLDSSLIAAIAQKWMRERGKTLKTFAVGLEGSPDIMAAREVAEFLGTDHHEKTYGAAEALKVVPEVVRTLEHFDPSLVRSSVSNYILGEFVADHADVVLTGEGSDEIFAGYRYLRDFDDPNSLHEELVNLFEGLHIGGLQRVDRTSSVHGLTVRLPFLSADMLRLGMSISPELKRVDRGEVEKRLLREAFAGWLPHDILWRKKAQFGDGSGAVDALQKDVAKEISEEMFARERNVIDPPLRSREELAYYRIYADRFGTDRKQEAAARFATV